MDLKVLGHLNCLIQKAIITGSFPFNRKVQNKIVADDNLLSLYFRENKALDFVSIVCQADDSHEMSSVIFSEK